MTDTDSAALFVRLDPADMAKVKADAQAANCSSIADYVRQQLGLPRPFRGVARSTDKKKVAQGKR